MKTSKAVKRNHIFSIVLITSTFLLGVDRLLDRAAWAVPFNPPSGGAPKGRGGASRGDAVCSSDPETFIQRFTTLAPSDSNYGLTVSQRPTLFAYIPPTSAQKAFFTIKEEHGRVHHQMMLPIASKGGILRIDLPQSAPPLKLGQRYQWGIALLCKGKLRPDSPFVSSWVQRVELPTSLTGKISPSASMEQVALYGANGIWYDMLATLADLKQQQPNNSGLQSRWSELLSSAGLGAIAQETPDL